MAWCVKLSPGRSRSLAWNDRDRWDEPLQQNLRVYQCLAVMIVSPDLKAKSVCVPRGTELAHIRVLSNIAGGVDKIDPQSPTTIFAFPLNTGTPAWAGFINKAS